MDISKFTYILPPELIAHSPTTPRDAARLLILDRSTQNILHKHFFDLPEALTANDVLVFNDTKVIPARLLAKKATGGAIEIFLVTKVNDNTWKCLHKGKLIQGQVLTFNAFTGIVVEKSDEMVTIQFSESGDSLNKLINLHGSIPLPPYIHSSLPEEERRQEYQTVYAKAEGSIASPTAGLHFTNELLEKLTQKGVQIEYVTLHVGLGTFMPIKEGDITKHIMHSEYFTLTEAVAKRLNQARRDGKRIISVGTTTTRVLETQCKNGTLLPGSGDTNIFIYPPYKFQFIDALITNFHLPHSTLLSLVSAFVSTPNTEYPFISFENSSIGSAYKEAIEQNYRFYSFGDGMLIV